MEAGQLEAAAFLLARVMIQHPALALEALRTQPASLAREKSLETISPWNVEQLKWLSTLFPWEGIHGAIEHGIFGTSVGQDSRDERYLQVYADWKGRDFLHKSLIYNEKLMRPTSDQEIPIRIVYVESIEFAAAPRPRHRPSSGGDSIGPLNGSETGTLGAWLKRNPSDTLIGISNNHIIADLNHFGVGHDVIQPGPADGGTQGDVIGQIEGIGLLKEHNPFQIDATLNLADVAWVRPTTPSAGVVTSGIGPRSILPRGEIDLIDQYKNGPLPLRIWMNGSLGIVQGTVTGNSVCVFIQKRGKAYYFEDQIEITCSNLAHGDSGSIVLNEHNEVGGLFFAIRHGDLVGYANPWQAVKQATGLSFLYT